MENHLYTCQYCSKEYEPTRRRVQKYCSTACRVSAHKLRKQITDVKEEEVPLPTIQNNDIVEPVVAEIYEPPKQKVEKMSAAGVGNAAAGTALVDIAKSLLTPEHQKAVTKGDIDGLKSFIKGERYFRVKNMGPDQFGRYPYFDKGFILYF